MPIYEFLCLDCGQTAEILLLGSEKKAFCEHCGGSNLQKLVSAPSAASGVAQNRYPGPADTSCCGSKPDAAGCAGPGSCCGRRNE